MKQMLSHLLTGVNLFLASDIWEGMLSDIVKPPGRKLSVFI
jgi:hypothetical protein